MNRQFLLLSFFAMSILFVKGQNKPISFDEYSLSNGLHVILYHNDATPNVMVSVMYHVGAKNEDSERTGFAHLFEHLMFEGSENIGRGEYFSIIQAAGGAINANTTQDRTYYFEHVPSSELELALWMESERLYHARIDSIGIATQKRVVIEEKKQVCDNRPYGSFGMEAAKRAFQQHPYRWVTLGNEKHIENATFEDVYNFYQTYYVPNNAVLVVAGDYENGQVREWIEKYFGSIPQGTLPFNRPDVVEPLSVVEVRDTVYDNIQLPAVFMAYHAPAAGTKESYAMDIVSRILYGGESSRLKTSLEDKGIATETFLLYEPSEEPNLLYVGGIANIDKNIKDVETIIDTEIKRMVEDFVSEEEFQMAIAAKEYQFANELRTLSGISSALAHNYTYFKDAGRINRELDYFGEITRKDILNVARKYLQPYQRVVLYYLPELK